jgi:aldehyde:ferredoxin oxidoreductase
VTSFSPITGYNAPAFPGGAFAAYLKAAEFNPLLKLVTNGCK